MKKDYKVASEYVHALKGVSLDFRASEFVCILGQSGCGKTTLLNIIGGLDHYTSGDLVIQGKSTKDFSDRDWDVYRNHRIGFIFQSYNLIPHQTVLGNVEIALTIAGVSREERKKRATEALERVGLGEHLNKKPNQLSGGQCQRVAIARALVNNPDILLADEPTGALDSETSVQIMELIKEIAAERLVIMVTHNPELAELYASRIVRLKDGLVEEDTNPYTEEEQPAEAEQPAEPVEEEAAEEETAEEAPEKKKKEKKPRAKMNFLSSLALSARNLLTKKGRTIITSIAGSIGIISVCLVLALSNGFNHYIKRTEEDMLSYYPVQISESTYDMMSIMMSFTSGQDTPDMKEIGDRVYVNSFLTGLAQGMTVKNDISEHYLKYVSEADSEWYSAIQYSYGASLTDNLFTTVTTGDVEINGETVPEVTRNLSLSELKRFYIEELEQYKPEYSALVSFARFFGNIVTKMP
ncbi:MAG: ABC transporter ATP-binding protein, partial [Clostridia bacterium]|nr:ABC transporter ATP-binding protein [Clostridia bacterium]